MSEYGKIETLYERNPDTFKVRVGEFKNRTYTLLKQWRWTEKIDGTNIRVKWCAENSEHCKPHIYFGGKTDNAQIHADLFKHLQQTFTVDKLQAVSPETNAV